MKKQMRILLFAVTLVLGIFPFSTSSFAAEKENTNRTSEVVTPDGFYLYKDVTTTEHYSSNSNIPTQIYYSETHGAYTYSGWLYLQKIDRIGSDYYGTYSGTISVWVD